MIAQSCPGDADVQQAPKVVLLEFALVRCGSNVDLGCEEAPEAGMFLEPLPTPRSTPKRDLGCMKQQYGSFFGIPWDQEGMPQHPLPMPTGETSES